MKPRFQTLQDSLRSGIWARLERGELTGKSLARKAGFQQAHLSNFLNGKRGLSLQAMDRLLDVLHLDVLQLAEVNQAAHHAAGAAHPPQTEPIALVTLATAARTTRFGADDIQDIVSFPRSFLRRFKPKTVGNRRDWTRFAVITLDQQNTAGMSPQLRAGARVLIDRHFNAPTPGDTASPDLYAVMNDGEGSITRVTLTPRLLILRTLDETEGPRIRLIHVPPGRRPGDLIVGRVRHIAMEV